MSGQVSSSNKIVTFRRPKDEKLLKSIGYPIFALDEDDRAKQEEIKKKYAPNIFSRLMNLKRRDNIVIFLAIWIIVPVCTVMYADLLEYQDKIISSITSCTLLSIVVVIFNLIAPRIKLKRDAVNDVLETMKYNPYPQSHTRGYEMIQESINISGQILDSWAWKNDMAVKSVDVKAECLDIINGVLDIYQKDNGIREVVSDISKAKLNDYQKRLDKIRHYARYDMTNPDTQSMDILEAG